MELGKVEEKNQNAVDVTASKEQCLVAFHHLRQVYCKNDVTNNVRTIKREHGFRLDKQNTGMDECNVRDSTRWREWHDKHCIIHNSR